MSSPISSQYELGVHSLCNQDASMLKAFVYLFLSFCVWVYRLHHMWSMNVCWMIDWTNQIRKFIHPIGEGNGTPLQYSCLENPMDRRAWWAAVHGVAKSRTRLSNFTFTHWRRKWQPTPVLAWRISGTGEPGGLPSVGSHRVEHDWSNLAAAYIPYWSKSYML